MKPSSSTPICSFRQSRRFFDALYLCAFHSPDPMILSPVESTIRWIAPSWARLSGGSLTIRFRRESVVWSGALRSRPIKLSSESSKPSVWRSGRPKTTRRVKAVRMARFEYRRWAPRRPFVTGRAADSLYGWGETGYGAFVYHYRPNPDWPNGLLGGENAELWKVAGNDRGYAAESPRASAPQVCDISQTRFEWGRPSVSDPYSEFPVREFVGASYRELTSPDAASWRERAESPKTVFLQAVPKEAFQAWSLLNYDRPQKDRSNKDRSKSGRPKGAAVQSSRAVSPVKLTRQELSRYRSGKELALHSVNMVDFQIAVKATTHAAVLPPPCEPGSRPILRVLALRVETSDLSVRPFHEAWLFAYCRVGGRPLWYALSHIVSEDGDVLHGRETFGYPSLHGNIDAMVTTEGFSLSASRQGREFVRGEGSVRGFSTGTSLAKIDIVGLRAGPFQEGEAPRGELVAQTWFFQGRRLYGDPKIAKLEFPARKAPGGIGRPSPWFEFTPFHLMSAAGVEDVGMQRGPGRIVAQVTDFTPYYRERCDGLLPGEQPPVTSVQPTFLGQRLPATRPGRVRGRVESESAGAAKNGDTAR